MPYNTNYFPVGYQTAQMYYPQYQVQNQQMAQMQNQQNAQQTAPTIQQSGFVRVQSENEARMYPVALGTSVTFIDENAPYCYVKTMDVSQLDRPKFEKYQLIKVEDAPQAPQTVFAATQGQDDIQYASKNDLSELWSEINALKSKIDKPKKPKKVEEEGDDDE